MIKLDIEEYCQECPDFIPTLQGGITADDYFQDRLNTDHRVVCINRYKCINIHKHIKKGISKNAE